MVINAAPSMERAASRRRTGAAFTLIELLVVVSIIALLIAILLPALKRARQQAGLTACLSNMAHLAKASLTYAADHGGTSVVPAPLIFGTEDPDNPGTKKRTPSAYEWGGKSGRGQGGVDSIWSAHKERGAYHRPLNHVVYKSGFRRVPVNDTDGIQADQELNLKIYRCPADTGYTNVGWNEDSPGSSAWSATTPWRDSQLSAYDHYGNSYVANGFWVVTVDGFSGAPDPEGPVKTLTSFLRPLSRIPTPSNTLLYREANARFAWRWSDGPPDCNFVDGQGGYTMGWHGRRWTFSACFTDGHAVAIKMQGVRTPAPDLGSTYPDWGGPPGWSLYDYWKCLTFRGDGWQLDTLPSPPIEIGVKLKEM